MSDTDHGKDLKPDQPGADVGAERDEENTGRDADKKTGAMGALFRRVFSRA